jgi:glycosyltransferase involved in cell wall biosynthesis
VNGFLAEVGDIEAMARHALALGMDKELRKEMGKAGRLTAELSFQPEIIVPQYEALYAEAIRLQS